MNFSNNGEIHNKASNQYNVPNKYLMLLKRLDEDEGIIDPSIEEKLKLAEDQLRLTCVKFCEDVATLLDGEKAKSTGLPVVVDADTVQRLFQPKCFKPSLHPPKSQLREIGKEGGQASISKHANYELKENPKARKKLQQAFYLPPSSWFSSEIAGSDLSNEEVELLSSCATKVFVKFLEEKKMEIPNIFSRILENSPRTLEYRRM